MGTTPTPHRWREDLHFLRDAVLNGHPNPFHTTSRATFEAAVNHLEQRIPNLARHEIIVGFSAILALVGDGHTSLFLPWNSSAEFGRYPLRFHAFSDGLRVSSAAPDHQDLLGAKVLRIGALSASEALERTATVVSRDNAMGSMLGAADCLIAPEICHALGIVPALEEATFVVELDARAVPVHLSASSLELPRWGTVPGVALPLWLQRNDEPYWVEHLPDHRALYVQYNAVRDAPDEPLEAFFRRVFALSESHGAQCLIVDLRHNGGGNMDLNRPLIHGLIRSDRLNRRGQVFALTGRQTFSAAMNCAVDLERHTNTLFVGEPTGSSPNFYGETNWTTLPHCRVGFSYSSLYWQCSSPADQRPWIEPHISAPLSSTDLLAGRDPALEAALAYPASLED
jgi:hypothetical protein